MQHYYTLIAAELLTWPQVTNRRIFGLTLFYRQGLPFVVLRETKDFEATDRVGFKLHVVNNAASKLMLADDHLAMGDGAKWITFALREDRDETLFLRWAHEAYSSCGKR